MCVQFLVAVKFNVKVVSKRPHDHLPMDNGHLGRQCPWSWFKVGASFKFGFKWVMIGLDGSSEYEGQL